MHKGSSVFLVLRMKQGLKVFKIGGKVIDQPASLDAFLGDLSAIAGAKILVHGGGKTATQMAGRLGVATQMIEGRRVTTPEMLEVVLMVYGGLVSKKIVAGLQALGCDAIGLTGADMNCISAERRPAGAVDYGLVGDIQKVNASVFARLLAQQVLPVLAPLTHDRQGQLLNTNADTIAAAVATALSATYAVDLYFCFEQPGVMADLAQPGSLIPSLDEDTYLAMKKEGSIAAGMVPKLDNAFGALQQGVDRVYIIHYTETKHIDNQHFKATNLCI